MNNLNSYLEIINKCFKYSIPIYISSNKGDTVFQSIILELSSEAIVLKNTVPYYSISDFLSSDIFFLQCETNQYATKKINGDGINIIFPFEQIEVISETRESDRIYSYNQENHIEFVNPYDQTTVLKKPMVEYSVSGCSIKSHIDSKLFEAGFEFKDLNCQINNQVYKKSGKVVYTKKILDLDGKTYKQVGFKFDNKIA